MAAQAYTPEIDPEDPSRGRQQLLQATTLTGREGAPWEALHTALYWGQGSPNSPDTPEPTEAWVMQAKAMRNYHLRHPFDDSPAALPWPSDPPEPVRKLADIIGSHAKAKMQTPAEPPLRDPGQQATHPLFKPHAPPSPATSSPAQASETAKGHTRPQPSRKSSDLSTPRIPPDPPGEPRPSIILILPPTTTTAPPGASILVILPPSTTAAPPGPGILIIPPPATSTAPAQGVPRIRKGENVKVQQPFRNDHTGDWIWCEGTIQYRLKEPGDNGGPQIRVIWHRQKKLDQGSSAPDKPVSYTLELTSAHPIRLHTEENKSHTGTKCTGELPPEWSQGLPPPRLPKRPPTGKKSPSPRPPPSRGNGRGHKPPQPRPAPTEATVNLLDLNHPAVTYSKDASTALQELRMAQGPEWVPHLLTFQEQVLQRDDPPETTPIYTPDQKAYKCYWHKGTPLYAQTGIHVHIVHHLSVPGRLGVYEVVGDGWQLNVINTHVPFGEATEPFLQALAEAYRQMAMLAPTVIIGDMNAAATPADRGGQATPQDQAVRDTIEMLGLVDLTANLEGHPSHFPDQTDAASSRIDVCYGDPTTIIRAEARYGPLPLGPTGHSPLHIRLTIPNLPPSPPEDADQGLPPPLKMPPLHDKHVWSQYHRAKDRARRIQPDPTDLVTAMHTAAVACGFQQHPHTDDNQPPTALGDMLHDLWHAKQQLATLLHTDTPQTRRQIHHCRTQIAHIRADLQRWHIHRQQRIAQDHERYAQQELPYKAICHLNDAMTDTGHRTITTVRQEDGSLTNDPATVLQATQDSFLRQHTPTQDTLDPDTQAKIDRLPRVLNHAQRRQLEKRPFTIHEVRKAIHSLRHTKPQATTASLRRHTTISPPTSSASSPTASGTSSRGRPPCHQTGQTLSASSTKKGTGRTWTTGAP